MQQRLPIKGIVDFLTAKCRPQRQKSPCDPLGEGNDVRRSCHVGASKKRAASPKACQHFIGNQKGSMCPCKLKKPLKTRSRMHSHSKCPLDERLIEETQHILLF